MFKQIKLWSVIALMFFACNENEQVTTQLSTQDAEFVQLIADESKSMFSSVIGDLKNEFQTSSLDELTEFDSESFTEQSVLKHSKSSELREVIKQVFTQRRQMQSARVDLSSYTEQEKGFLEELKNAFSLMPDVGTFKNEIASINLRIVREIGDENAKLRLLAISASSEATAIYWAENQEQILSEITSVAQQLQADNPQGKVNKYGGNGTGILMRSPSGGNGRVPIPSGVSSSGGTSSGGTTCCFQGDFQWNWERFGTNIVGGAIIGGSTAWVVNIIPGIGPIGYGTAIVGGAVGVALTYTWGQFEDWMFSESDDIIEEKEKEVESK